MARSNVCAHLTCAALLVSGFLCSLPTAEAVEVSATFQATVTVSKKNQAIVCGKTTASKWVAGRLVRKKGIQSFLSYQEDIKKLKKQIKSSSSSLKDKLSKRLKFLRSLVKVANTECESLGAIQDQQNIPAPVAMNGSASGRGLEPIAIEFAVDGKVPGAPITCALDSADESILVQLFENCTGLIKPKSHRSGTASLRFKAIRLSDNKESNIASFQVSWDQSGNFIGDSHSMARYRDSLSPEEARYLARWVGLGDDMEEAVAIGTQAGGLDALVNKLLTPSSPDCPEVEAQAIEASWRDKLPYCEYDTTLGMMFCTPDTQAGRMQWNSYALNSYFLHHLRYSCNPLRERIALLWHNHFSVNMSEFDGTQSPHSHVGKSHLDLLRANIPESGGSLFTPFETLVAYMHGKDGAMLRYLNNNENSFNTGGNENYARELLELFTLGVDDVVTKAPNYSEQHVYDMRYAVMGYHDVATYDSTHVICCNTGCPFASCNQCASLPAGEQCRTGNRYLYQPQFTDTRWNFPNQPIATFQFAGAAWERFGVWKANVFDSGEDNLTSYLVREVPGVARFVAARLIATFAGTDITEEMIAPVAEALQTNNFEITEALRIILSSSSFFSSSNRYDGVTAPVETYVSFIRALALPIQRVVTSNDSADLFGWLRVITEAAGQRLFAPPSVFGWPEIGKITGGKIHNGTAFMSIQRWLERWRGIVQYLNELQRTISLGGGYNWSQLLPPAPLNRNTPAIVDHFLVKLGFSVSATTRQKLIEYLNTVVTQTVVQNGVEVPAQNARFSINWNTLTDQQLTSLWSIKGPGLLTILFTLPDNNLR